MRIAWQLYNHALRERKRNVASHGK